MRISKFRCCRLHMDPACVARRSDDHYDWAWLGDVSPYVWNLNFHAIDIHWPTLEHVQHKTSNLNESCWVNLSPLPALLCSKQMACSAGAILELRSPSKESFTCGSPSGGPKHICPKELTILAHPCASWMNTVKHETWKLTEMHIAIMWTHTHTHTHVNHVNHVIYL